MSKLERAKELLNEMPSSEISDLEFGELSLKEIMLKSKVFLYEYDGINNPYYQNVKHLLPIRQNYSVSKGDLNQVRTTLQILIKNLSS